MENNGCGKMVDKKGLYICGSNCIVIGCTMKTYDGIHLCPSCSSGSKCGSEPPNHSSLTAVKDTEPLGKPRGSPKEREKWREDYHKRKDTEKYRTARNIRKKREYANNKEKYQARGKARGEIALDGECEVCKVNPQKHRHHEDYSQPLQVIKVCVPCHNKIHNAGDLAK